MIIDTATLLLLSIVFATLSLSEKLIILLTKKGHLKKLNGFISNNKNKIEASIKNNSPLNVDDDPDIKDILDEIKDMEDVIHITGELIDLIAISS